MKRREKCMRALTAVAGLATAAMVVSAGCQPLPADSLVNADDVTIRLSAIDPIVQDPDLTEEEKKQQLMDLGITDESLIDALLISQSSASTGT